MRFFPLASNARFTATATLVYLILSVDFLGRGAHARRWRGILVDFFRFPFNQTNGNEQVTGLVHDLGKLLHFFGSEGQWDVVGVSNNFPSIFFLGLVLPIPPQQSPSSP